MRRRAIFPYILLGLALLAWTNLSRPSSDSIRAFSVAALSPVWKIAEARQNGVEEVAHLRLENQTLKSQIQWLQDLVFQAQRVPALDAACKRAETERVQTYLASLLQRQMNAMPAQVIYRDPSSWSSTLWINVGEEDNRAVGRVVITRNSPVLYRGSLIGVIDHVGNLQSRVRLITDPSLSLAVRAARGSAFNGEILYAIDLLDRIVKDKEELSKYSLSLQELKRDLENKGCEVVLAKGELHGNGSTLWRIKTSMLKGIGFNYDRADAEGGARDLRTGRPLQGRGEAIPLIQPGDLLVTSGLDGVFPPGISVATVTEVSPIKEGGLSYDIEAAPMAGSLTDLGAIFVLPALSGE